MIGALGTAGLLLGANGFGALLSLRMAGAPDGTPNHPAARLRRHLPVIAANTLAQTALAAGIVGAFPGAFTLAWPGLLVVVAQVTLVMVADDAGFYLWHRWLHEHKGAYRAIHAMHHRAHDPLPIEYLYAHPIEWIGGSIAPSVSFAIIGLLSGGVPLWSFWAFGVVRIGHELDIHRGKAAVVWAFPGLADARDHALHHARPNAGNYGSTFRWWDRWFGTVAAG